MFGREIFLFCKIYNLPVNTIHCVAGAKKATVTAVAFVYQRVAASPALDHGVEVPRGSLGRVVLLSLQLRLEKKNNKKKF